MSESEHVEEIQVPPVPDEQPPGRGDLDPADDYVEGVNGDPGEAQ